MAITTAMPAVKPSVTGGGMYSISRPSRASPMATRITAAISEAVSRPASPYVCEIG